MHDDVAPSEFGNQYSKVYKDITRISITQVEVEDTLQEGLKVTIRLHRPGILVGVKGSNLEALTSHLSKDLKKRVVIHIIEERLNDYLYPSSIYDEDCY